MKNCDICGKRDTNLFDLLSIYQTEGIKDVCSDCIKEVNDHLFKLKSLQAKITQHWFKKFLVNLCEKYKGANSPR